MRKIFSETIAKLIANDKKIHLISLDAGQGVFSQIIKENPDHYWNFGVTEQASLGLASGMALEGLKPYVYAITPFLLERAFEQIKLDIVEQKANVKIIGYWAYPGTGPTHFTENPEGICRILKIPFYKPINSEQTKEMIFETYAKEEPAFFSLSEDPFITEEKKIVDTAVALLLNEKDEVLLQKKDMDYPWFPGKWCLPGGGVEKCETPEYCIKREILEEIGQPLKEFYLFDTRKFSDRSIDNKIREGRVWVYIIKWNLQIKDLKIKEGAGLAYFSKDEINDIPLPEHDYKILKDYYKF